MVLKLCVRSSFQGSPRYYICHPFINTPSLCSCHIFERFVLSLSPFAVVVATTVAVVVVVVVVGTVSLVWHNPCIAVINVVVVECGNYFFGFCDDDETEEETKIFIPPDFSFCVRITILVIYLTTVRYVWRVVSSQSRLRKTFSSPPSSPVVTSISNILSVHITENAVDDDAEDGAVMGWDGMGWDGMGWDGMGSVV